MKHKKKILVFIDWFFPGYRAGGPIQSCVNLIDHLRDEYDFYVVTRNIDYCDTTPYPDVKYNQWNELKEGVRVYYFSSDHLNKSNIIGLLNAESYDAFYLNGMYSWYFTIIPLLELRKQHNKKVILASRGMLAESALKIKPFKKKLYLRVAKFIGLFKRVSFHVTNPHEMEDVKIKIGSNTHITLASNLPKKIILKQSTDKNKEEGLLKLINIARISPEKNLKFALNVLSKIKGPVEFDIYGPVYDEAYWSECLDIIEKMPGNIKVKYKGAIESEKINSALSNYHFMFMPTLGENFGHIIIESMSAGCPVIISDQTMWKDLASFKSGWDLSLSDEQKYISTVEKCISMKQAEYAEWAEGAFRYARSYYENQEILIQNRKLFT